MPAPVDGVASASHAKPLQPPAAAPTMAAQDCPPSRARPDAAHDMLTCTVASPPFSYAHLELVTDGPGPVELDNLEVRSYCTAALRQFLGLTGEAIAIDILKTQGAECWLRVPRPDLASFAAAITAWKGVSEGGTWRILRIKQCSDWLGFMVGTDGHDSVWDR